MSTDDADGWTNGWFCHYKSTRAHIEYKYTVPCISLCFLYEYESCVYVHRYSALFYFPASLWFGSNHFFYRPLNRAEEKKIVRTNDKYFSVWWMRLSWDDKKKIKMYDLSGEADFIVRSIYLCWCWAGVLLYAWYFTPNTTRLLIVFSPFSVSQCANEWHYIFVVDAGVVCDVRSWFQLGWECSSH